MFPFRLKKYLPMLLAPVVVIALVLGCSTPSPAPATTAAASAPAAKPTEPPAAAKAAPTTAAAAAPTAKQILTAAMDLEVKTLDPLFGDAPGGPDRYLANLLYDGLFRAEADGSLTPMLAESWRVSDDGKTITFNLRKGVKFHDGTDFNAEAAAFNLNRVASKETNSPRRSDVPALVSAEVADPYTLRVLFSEPSAATMTNLAYEAGRMASPTAVKSLGKDYGRKPVGTGPFKFVEWRSGDRFVFERNGDYWRTDKDGKRLPYIDGLVIRYIADVAVKLVELRSGNIQIADYVSPRDFETIKRDQNLKLVDSPGGILQWMSFNVSKPPFDNEKLREALSYAIDRDSLNKAITLGLGTVTPNLAVPGEWTYDAGIPYPKYDLNRAKSLMAEAGYANGLKATMSIIQRDPDTQIAQLMQAQLKQIGVDVQIEVMERQAWVDKVLGAKHEMAQLRVGVPRPDPANTFAPSFGTGAGNNWSAVNDAELTKLVDDAGKTLDQAKRKEMYKRIQERINEKDYYAFLFFRPVAFPMSNKVQSFPMDVDGAWRIAEVKVAP